MHGGAYKGRSEPDVKHTIVLYSSSTPTLVLDEVDKDVYYNKSARSSHPSRAVYHDGSGGEAL